MDILESKAFRTVLIVVTVVVLFLVLQKCSSDTEFGGEVRSDATEDTTDTTTIPELDLTVEPDTVVTQATSIPSQQANVLVYPVESGDTLNDIAIRFNVSIDVILRANPSLDVNSLQIGQKIQLPGATLDPTALDNPSVEREPGVTVKYFVESGDTMGLIAEKYTVSVDALMSENPGVDPGGLQVGQELQVPPFGSGFTPEELTPVATTTPIPREIGEPLTYQVQSGDSLVGLAAAYGVSLDALMGANDIDDPNAIFVGQELLIPPPQQG